MTNKDSMHVAIHLALFETVFAVGFSSIGHHHFEFGANILRTVRDITHPGDYLI